MLNQGFPVNLAIYLFLGIMCTLSANKQDAGFQFARVWYESHPGFRESAWATDYPTAEYNLHEAISRTTGLQLEGAHRRLHAERRGGQFFRLKSPGKRSRSQVVKMSSITP